jgi:hypothetical protein
MEASSKSLDALDPFFERFFNFRQAQRVPAEKTSKFRLDESIRKLGFNFYVTILVIGCYSFGCVKEK